MKYPYEVVSKVPRIQSASGISQLLMLLLFILLYNFAFCFLKYIESKYKKILFDRSQTLTNLTAHSWWHCFLQVPGVGGSTAEEQAASFRPFPSRPSADHTCYGLHRCPDRFQEKRIEWEYCTSTIHQFEKRTGWGSEEVTTEDAALPRVPKAQVACCVHLAWVF